MNDFVNAAFGIDHPLLTVADLDDAAARLEALGFVVTPRGRHPWGTHNRLALFPGGLLELITIGDDKAVDDGTVDHLLFGRRVRQALLEAEGISMVALHSTNLEADTAAAHVAVNGLIDFRRPITLPDGSKDEAVVRLAMLTDDDHPRLANFLCQQMKRGLVEVAEWRQHANSARRLYGVTYLDDAEGSAERRCTALWGEGLEPGRHESAGGMVDVVTPETFATRFPDLTLSASQLKRRPAAIAVTVLVADLDCARRFVMKAVPQARDLGTRLLVPATYLADTIIEFVTA